MKKGQAVTISEIKNGVMIQPTYNSIPTACNEREIIAFDSADKFIEWIKTHFQIYEVPKWDDDKERIMK